MDKEKKILLSFDVEEFDLPVEYGRMVSIDAQLETGHNGLIKVKELLKEKKIPATLFTTAFFADNFSSDIKELSECHEIASHTYFHTSFKSDDLWTSKEKLAAITGKEVHGLRMPRMKMIDSNLVKAAGYIYNSSINPTWIPGRYNNLSVSRRIFSENQVIQFPVSVTPHLRIPLFWLAFKNMPYSLFLRFALQTLRKDGYLCLYFHPWEFIDLGKYQLPSYISKGSNKKLLIKLARLIDDLSREADFSTMHEFLTSKNSFKLEV